MTLLYRALLSSETPEVGETIAKLPTGTLMRVSVTI